MVDAIPGLLDSFLGTATRAADPQRPPAGGRVTVSNPDYYRRSTFPLLEELLSVVVFPALREALRDASPYIFNGDGIHSDGQQICKLGQPRTLTGKTDDPSLPKIEAGVFDFTGKGRIIRPLAWVEFDADAKFIGAKDEELLERARKATGAGIVPKCGALVCTTWVDESEGRDRTKVMHQVDRMTREVAEYDLGEFDQFDAISTATTFLYFKGRYRATEMTEVVRPSAFSVTMFWKGEKALMLVREVRDDYAAPLYPLAFEQRTSTMMREEAVYTLGVACAAILGLGSVSSPDVAGCAVPDGATGYDLFRNSVATSPKLAKMIEDNGMVRFDVREWVDWVDQIKSGPLAANRFAWYSQGLPSEPPLPCGWMEVAIATNGVVEPGRTDGRMGLLWNHWASSEIAEKIGAIHAKDGSEPIRIMDRDRWYVCYLFAIGDNGQAFFLHKGVAYGFGGGTPLAVYLNIDPKQCFDGIQGMDPQFNFSDDRQLTMDKNQQSDAAVAKIVTGLLSSMNDPMARMEASREFGGYRFRWHDDARPDGEVGKPPQNWPYEAERPTRRQDAKPEKKAEPPRWGFQTHLNTIAADAGLCEWAWKNRAIYALTYEQQVEYAMRHGRAVHENEYMGVGFDLEAAFNKWKSKSVRDPFDDGWPKKIADWAFKDRLGLLIWASFFGDGPKTFRPTVKEFEALRHVECRFPQSMYRQPFETLGVEFPSDIGDRWDIWDAQMQCDARPVAAVLHHPTGKPGLFVNMLFSSGMERLTAIPMGLTHPERGDVEMEEHVRALLPATKLAYILGDDKMKLERNEGESDQAFEDRMKHEGLVCSEIVRVAINAAFLLVQGGCRKVGLANPIQHKDLKHQVDAKKARPEVKERARQALLAQAVVYGFDQTIKVYDEGSTFEPNGDPAKAGYHVKPHWRHGCFVNQPCGAGRAQRKVIYRKPIFVNQHLFGGSMAAAKVTMVRVPAGEESKLPDLKVRGIPDADE